MKFDFWATAIVCAFISFIVFMGVLEAIFYPLPSSRVQTLGYKVAGILVVAGIAGLAIGIKILKKKPMLAGGLIGFFSVSVVLGILTFIVGP